MRAARLAPVLALLALTAPPASAAQKPKPRVVLVEADGPEVELSAFVARLESELTDGEKVGFSDGRLAGASLGSLAAEPEGETARKFRAEWPGEKWLAVSLAPCHTEVSRMTYRDTTPEGYPVQRVIESVGVECPVTVRIADALTGKEGKPLEATGSASYRRTLGEDEEQDSSEVEGAHAAAKKVAKKLPSLVTK